MTEDIVEKLATLSQEQNLVDRAFEGCRLNMKSYALEEAERLPGPKTGPDLLHGIHIDNIQLRLDKQSLIFQHGKLSYPYIDTELGLYVEDKSGFYLRDLKSIGYYRFITHLDGRVDDDYFVLEKQLIEERVEE